MLRGGVSCLESAQRMSGRSYSGNNPGTFVKPSGRQSLEVGGIKVGLVQAQCGTFEANVKSYCQNTPRSDSGGCRRADLASAVFTGGTASQCKGRQPGAGVRGERNRIAAGIVVDVATVGRGQCWADEHEYAAEIGVSGCIGDLKCEQLLQSSP